MAHPNKKATADIRVWVAVTCFITHFLIKYLKVLIPLEKHYCNKFVAWVFLLNDCIADTGTLSYCRLRYSAV